MRFRNVPVLAEETSHVAAGRAHAEDARAGQKMVQRFFFDGINLQRGWGSITKGVELSILIDSDEAESRLPGMDMAVARAEESVHAAVALRLAPSGSVQRVRLLG